MCVHYLSIQPKHIESLLCIRQGAKHQLGWPARRHSPCSESHASLSHGDTWQVMKKLRRKEEAYLLYVGKELVSEKNFSKEMMHELSDEE